jgi:hypothetical protein
VIWLVLFLLPKIATTVPVTRYADVTVQVEGQKLSVLEVKPGSFDKPTTLPRYRGRFVARALAGEKVLEEVRIDLPLLADAETTDASDEARHFAEGLRKGVKVKARIRVPLPDGADHILISDGKSGRSVKVSLATAPAPSPSGAPSPGGAGAGAPPAR